MGNEVQHPCCGARSERNGTPWWYCSLPPGHDGDHKAYDLNVLTPYNFIAAWRNQ